MALGNAKQAIFETAATLFAQEGYHEVSMKQIAQAVGIAPPSIYNHFSSKDAILAAVYSFLDEKSDQLKPDLNELLEQCETMHPHDILQSTTFIYSDCDAFLVFCAVTVAIAMMRSDPRAVETINRNLIQITYEYDIPLLDRMQELGRIEPIDSESFALIRSSYCFSATVRFCTTHPIGTKEWLKGSDLLVTLVRPTAAVKESRIYVD